MTDYREQLLDRMIHTYNLEHPLVIAFAYQCMRDDISDKSLTSSVEYHERYPMTDDEILTRRFN